MRLEDVDQLADEVPQAGHGAFAGLSEHGLEAGEGLLDRVEVPCRAEEQQAGAGGLIPNMATGIIQSRGSRSTSTPSTEYRGNSAKRSMRSKNMVAID
jgi:hypothetical protein